MENFFETGFVNFQWGLGRLHRCLLLNLLVGVSPLNQSDKVIDLFKHQQVFFIISPKGYPPGPRRDAVAASFNRLSEELCLASPVPRTTHCEHSLLSMA